MPESMLDAFSTCSGVCLRGLLRRMSIAAAQFGYPAIRLRLDFVGFMSVLHSLIQAYVQGLCGTHNPVIGTCCAGRLIIVREL
jgi:hypothetical protein